MSQADTNSQLRYASDPSPEQTDAIAPRLDIAPLNVNVPDEQKGKEVLRLAQEAFAKTGSWVVFYREMLGVDGVVRKLFPDSESMRQFEASDEFAELQEMVAAMRSQDPSKGDSAEPERMITIRLPMSLHDALKVESAEMNLSINKLCISKLLQPVAGRFIPLQQGRRRGRRPGPQGPRKQVQDAMENASKSTESEVNSQGAQGNS
ncbi:hypothetical protein RMSM_02876 [Rhodopirellula maiorica SM1]|uniref:HicB family protein n=1 Tax=Rhodopirellula maiorica SM1 TaxID=1265738 RepID=M5S1Z9_9BACT|nr:hypothetical protein [Rhodopirellula maiorica]EMI20199.1 hypothetical protein RMSM_02876 [Rhodopirellula maiorica SM1]